jgi:hypothetical protein
MNKHRLTFLAAAALAALTISCAPHHARVGVYADVPGPPALAFEADPYFVPLPGTYVYAVPDYDVDLYYADGYYWRPWQGRWYRSTYYDRGWAAFSGVPYFYTSIPRGWRDDYRSRRWRGHSWDYARVPRHEVERNWSTWKRERRWDDDPRRYSGDRRWHDDDRRHTRDRDGRDWDGRDGDRRGAYEGDYDRRDREADPRVYGTHDAERRVYERAEPVDRRTIEKRSVEVERRPVERRSVEVERRPVERRSVEVERRPVERHGIEQRSVEVERRAVEPREVERRAVEVDRRPVERRHIERREAAPVSRDQLRPVVKERQTIEQREVHREGRGPGPDVTPRGRGPVRKDENRDGIDDSLQRPR